MSVWSRLANVFRSGRLQRELDEELQFHIDERARELTAAGMTPEAAAREAARRFGSPLRLREQSLDVKRLPSLDALIRDVRLAGRMLRKNGIGTAAAVASLALALGACVAAFALADALILRPLPVTDPQRLVHLTFPSDEADRPEADTFNDPLFIRLRDAGRGHAALFAMSTQVMRPAVIAGGDGAKELVRTQYVSGDAFRRLGVAAAEGRLISPADDVRQGAQPMAVLSHAFWMRRFGGEPAAIGRWLAIEDRQFQIAGVAEPRFIGVEPGRPTDVWLPYATYNQRAFGNASFNWFRVFGRLNDGVHRDAAESVLQAAFTGFRREFAERAGSGRPPEAVARFVNAPLHLRPAANGPSPLRRQFERPLWILAAIALLILLIAGSNVANLFLARTAAREREMAVRLSMGAGRGRLVQQMLVESALLASMASALGLLFAAIAAPAVVGTLGSPADPIHLALVVNGRFIALAMTLALLTTAMFGVAPAVRASTVAPVRLLKAGDARGGTRIGAMRSFVALQVAFGVAVVFVGGLLVLSFARLAGVDPGFATDVALVSLEPVQRIDADRQRAALIDVLDRLRAMPGVQSASAAEFNPLGRAWTHNTPISATGADTIESTMQPVTPGYFETMRVALLAGRTFDRRELDAESTAIVVNETFARKAFGGAPAAVGRVLHTRFFEGDTGPYEIVGVVADTKYDLRKSATPTIYIHLSSRPTVTLQVRASGDDVALASRIREEVGAASPLYRVAAITTQAAVVARTLIRERLLAALAGFFALVGLVLAAVGLYGVLSYSVSQRTREIGIRTALGAGPLQAARTVLADAGGAATAGAAVGLGLGIYGSRFVASLLFEVQPLEFASVALPLALLLATAVVAAVVPAARAARLDPAAALRQD